MKDEEERPVTPEVLRHDYIYLRLLGEGANGRTWLAQEILTGNEVAIKELKFYDNIKQADLFKREIEVLQSIQVRGVPKLYGSIEPSNMLEARYMIQEYIPHPSLQSLLDQGEQFDEKTVLSIMYEVGLILYELQNKYSPAILHRDIKPSNILYHNAYSRIEVFLIDFGSVANPQSQSEHSTIAGTFGYMAPEQLTGDAVIPSEYYSLGATALHLLTGVPPYNIKSDVFELKFESVLAEKHVKLSQHCIELLKSLLAVEVSKRPQTAGELLLGIRNVMEGYAPFVVKVKKRKNIILRKFIHVIEYWNRVFGKYDKCEYNMVTTGHIHSLNFIRDKFVFEYTYSCQGQTWCGYVDTADPEIEFRCIHTAYQSSEMQYEHLEPDQLSVRYNFDRPYDNVVEKQTIYLSEDLYKAYKRHGLKDMD